SHLRRGGPVPARPNLATGRGAFQLGRVLINRDCSAVGCLPQTTRADYVGCSGDLLPPSPPAEKATARQDQARKSGTGDGAWNGKTWNGKKCVGPGTKFKFDRTDYRIKRPRECNVKCARILYIRGKVIKPTGLAAVASGADNYIFLLSTP